MRLATLGVSYERMGKMLGFVKTALCKWLKQEKYKRPKLSGEVLKLGWGMNAGRGRECGFEGSAGSRQGGRRRRRVLLGRERRRLRPAPTCASYHRNLNCEESSPARSMMNFTFLIVSGRL